MIYMYSAMWLWGMRYDGGVTVEQNGGPGHGTGGGGAIVEHGKPGAERDQRETRQENGKVGEFSNLLRKTYLEFND